MFRCSKLYKFLTALSGVALTFTVAAQSAVALVEVAECGPHDSSLVSQTLSLQGPIDQAKSQNDAAENSRLLGIFARNTARILKAGPCSADFLSKVDKALLQDPIAKAILSDELDPLGRAFRDFEKPKGVAQ